MIYGVNQNYDNNMKPRKILIRIKKTTHVFMMNNVA
jgi:hypothetical protein